MGTNRLRSWRCGVTTVVLWTMLVTASTVEVYDEVPELDPSSYQDDSFLDTGPVAGDKRSMDLALAKDVLLYRLIRSMQQQMHPKSKYRASYRTDYQETKRADSEDLPEKEAIVKRLTNALGGSERNIAFRNVDMFRPQQKWKIKKGKSLGSQMVCYFKLCAFRSPT